MSVTWTREHDREYAELCEVHRLEMMQGELADMDGKWANFVEKRERRSSLLKLAAGTVLCFFLGGCWYAVVLFMKRVLEVLGVHFNW